MLPKTSRSTTAIESDPMSRKRRSKASRVPGVIAAKAFKEIVGEPAILARSVRKLMAGEPIQPVRNEDIFVDMKGRCDSLRKNICDIVVGVSAVVKISTESPLPFLRGNLVLSIRRMKYERFE